MRLAPLLIILALCACGSPSAVAPLGQATETPGPIIAQADAQQKAMLADAQSTQAHADLMRVNAIASQEAAYALQTAEAFTRSVMLTSNYLTVVSETAKITQQANYSNMTQAAGWANATQQARATDIYIDAERARVNAKIQSEERWESYKENTGLVIFGIACLSVLVFSGILAWRFDDILSAIIRFIDTIIRLIIDWRNMRTREKLFELAEARIIDVGGKKKWVRDDGSLGEFELESPKPVSPDNMRAWLLACREIAHWAEEYSWTHDDLGEVPNGGMYILSRPDWEHTTDYLRDCGVLQKRPSSKTRYADGWDYKRVLRELDKYMLPTELPPPVVKAPKLYSGELSKAS